MNFLELIMKRIHQIEEQCMQTASSPNKLHPKSARSVLDRTKANTTVEQEVYAELLNELVKKVNENQNYVPNNNVETEFTEPIANIIWVSQNVPKNKQFISGLDKILAHNLHL